MKVLAPPQSGSQDGLTASRNRYGQYYRRRSTPTNPRSSKQTAVRNQFGAVASAWRSLTPAEVLLWVDWAANHPFIDRLGSSRILAPNAAFEKVNMTLLQSGEAQVTVPPLDDVFVDLSGGALTYLLDTPTNTLEWNYPVKPTGKSMYYGTRPLSAGVNFFGDFRFLGAVQVGQTGDADIATLYQAVFGVPVEGQKVAIKVIESIGGYQGVPCVRSCIVAAAP